MLLHGLLGQQQRTPSRLRHPPCVRAYALSLRESRRVCGLVHPTRAGAGAFREILRCRGVDDRHGSISTPSHVTCDTGVAQSLEDRPAQTSRGQWHRCVTFESESL
jgi:hypothetical protein